MKPRYGSCRSGTGARACEQKGWLRPSGAEQSAKASLRGLAAAHRARVRVEARRDELHDRLLDRADVDAPRQVQVPVEQVAVPVLLRRPLPRPPPPRRVDGAGRVVGALERVQQREVGWQRLLGDHVADEHQHDLIRHARRALAQLTHLRRGERRGWRARGETRGGARGMRRRAGARGAERAGGACGGGPGPRPAMGSTLPARAAS